MQALAAITKDEGLKSLSVLYKVNSTFFINCLLFYLTSALCSFNDSSVIYLGICAVIQRLVDILEKRTHLPAVLQSLGCIAQTAMPVFETREGEVVEFIMSNILKSSNVRLLEKVNLIFAINRFLHFIKNLLIWIYFVALPGSRGKH